MLSIERVERYRTSDGEEFHTLAAAEAHEATGEYAAICDEVCAKELFLDPLSLRAQAFERLGNEIRQHRYATPGGKKRERKSATAAISEEAFISPEKMGPPQEGVDAYVDIGNVSWGDEKQESDTP